MTDEVRMRDIRELVIGDGPNDDYIIVAEYPEIDYALIYRNATYQPWVAANGLRRERKSWGHGHYFQTLEGAIDHINWVKEGRPE